MWGLQCVPRSHCHPIVGSEAHSRQLFLPITSPLFPSILQGMTLGGGGGGGGVGIRAVVNLCFTPAAQCGGVTVQAPLSLIYFRCFGACTKPPLPCILARSTWLQHWNLSRGLWEEGAIWNWILGYHKHYSQFYHSLWSSEELWKAIFVCLPRNAFTQGVQQKRFFSKKTHLQCHEKVFACPLPVF